MPDTLHPSWHTLLKTRGKMLTKAEELAALRRMRAGDNSARELLVLSQARYVTAIAMRYQDRGVPLDDLIQFGVCGLMRSLKTFDGRCRLSTYGTLMIHNEIKKGLDQTKSVIRVKCSARQRCRHGTMQLSELTRGIIAGNIASLDHPVIDQKTGSEAWPMCLLKQRREPDPSDAAELSEWRDRMRKAMRRLSPREAKILKRRAKEHRLHEIGESFGISRERVRQIERTALAKLRSHFGVEGVPPGSSLCCVSGRTCKRGKRRKAS